LFVGFLAFNGGSQLSITKKDDGLAVSIAIMNTVMGGSAGAIVSMILYKMTDALRGEDHYWSLIMTINGGLAGERIYFSTLNSTSYLSFAYWFVRTFGIFMHTHN